MKSANLSCGFMALLLLASVLFARPARPAAAVKPEAFGCGYRNSEGSPTTKTIWLFYPSKFIDTPNSPSDVITNNEGNQMGGYQVSSTDTSRTPTLTITKQDLMPGQVILPQEFKVAVYCEKPGLNEDVMKDPPALYVNNNQAAVSRLKNRGLDLEFRVNDGSWYNINQTNLKVLLPMDYYDAWSCCSSKQPFLYSQKNGGIAGRDTIIGLRLKYNPDGSSSLRELPEKEQIELGNLFTIYPTENSPHSVPHLNISNRGALRFKIARCKPVVDIDNPNLDFGTLTQYGLNMNGQYGKEVNITVRKTRDCTVSGGSADRLDYAVTGIKVVFKSSQSLYDDSHSMLLGEDGAAFPGLALSVNQCNNYNCSADPTPLHFGNPHPFFLGSAEASYVPGNITSKSQRFRFLIQKSSDGKEVATGLFHGSVTVKILYN